MSNMTQQEIDDLITKETGRVGLNSDTMVIKKPKFRIGDIITVKSDDEGIKGCIDEIYYCFERKKWSYGITVNLFSCAHDLDEENIVIAL